MSSAYFLHVQSIIKQLYLQSENWVSESDDKVIYYRQNIWKSMTYNRTLHEFVIHVYRYYLDNGPNASRDQHQQAGLLIHQIEEDDDGRQASPHNWKTCGVTWAISRCNAPWKNWSKYWITFSNPEQFYYSACMIWLFSMISGDAHKD